MAITRDTQELPGMKRAPISPIDKHPGGTLFREEEVKRGIREPLEGDEGESQPKDLVKKSAPFTKHALKRRQAAAKNAIPSPKKRSKKAGNATPKKKRGHTK